jgi:hypothetical protein
MEAPLLKDATSENAKLKAQLFNVLAQKDELERKIADLQKDIRISDHRVQYTSAEVAEVEAQTSAALETIQDMMEKDPSMQWQNVKECGYLTIFSIVTKTILPLFTNPKKFVTIFCGNDNDVEFIRLPNRPDCSESYAVRATSLHGIRVCVLEERLRYGK